MLTHRDDVLHVISLRPADLREFRRYEAHAAATTEAEDAAINAATAMDPDTDELSDEEFARLGPFSRGPGRPAGSGRKVPVTMRLDADVVAAFRAEGSGWQTRMNDALREWLWVRKSYTAVVRLL